MSITAADEEYYVRVKDDIEQSVKKGDEIFGIRIAMSEKYELNTTALCEIIFELIAKGRLWKAEVFHCFRVGPGYSKDMPDPRSLICQEISWTPPKFHPIDISDALLEGFDSVKVSLAQRYFELQKDGIQLAKPATPEEIQKLRESGRDVGRPGEVVWSFHDDPVLREIISEVISDMLPDICEEIKRLFYEVMVREPLREGYAGIFDDHPKLGALLITVERYHDDIYFVISDIERMLHRNVLRALLKLHGRHWYMSLARNLREDLARRYEYVREPMRVPELGSDLFPGEAELSLYEQATFGELRQIIVNQWSDFRNIVPNDLSSEELDRQLRFLLQTRNAVAHRVRDYEFSIDDFRRLLKIREQIHPSNWRFG